MSKGELTAVISGYAFVGLVVLVLTIVCLEIFFSWLEKRKNEKKRMEEQEHLLRVRSNGLLSPNEIRQLYNYQEEPNRDFG